MVAILNADPLECTGCRLCELACSFFFYKAYNPKAARLRVIRFESGIDLPVACRHCHVARCQEACPEDAISRSSQGLIFVNVKKCTGCGACVEACPFGAMYMHPTLNVAINCIVCGECAKVCPVQTIKYLTPDQIAQRRRRRYVKAIEERVLNQIGVSLSHKL